MSDYYEDDEDTSPFWLGALLVVSVISVFLLFNFFGGCESSTEKEQKYQKARLEQLESEVDYLLKKGRG